MTRREDIINEIISPCDQPLLELAGGLTEDLGIVKDIFGDRNSSDVTTSFVIGVIGTIIRRLANIKVNETDLVNFLGRQIQKENNKEED